jgi:hypothetical protein
MARILRAVFSDPRETRAASVTFHYARPIYRKSIGYLAFPPEKGTSLPDRADQRRGQARSVGPT